MNYKGLRVILCHEPTGNCPTMPWMIREYPSGKAWLNYSTLDQAKFALKFYELKELEEINKNDLSENL